MLPIKLIQLNEEVLPGAAYAMDWSNGNFGLNQKLLSEIWSGPGKDGVNEISKQEFDTLVQEYRREKGFLHFDDSAFEEGLRYYLEVLAKG
ncbi:hypothetical protein [Deinococcus arcticus]|uniref:hypothetical protein n=1 Tax=Deinococcus arcticus TaxID=2136176 RepID=UPI0011B29B76|nr:hypothetical protein [Deinococcus arcticus]